MSLSNVALCCLHLEDFSRGLRAAHEAVETMGEPQSASDALARVLVEGTYTRLLLAIGSRSAAQERCEHAKRYATQSRSERAEMVAAMAEGLCEVYVGKIDMGLSRLTQVLERARTMRNMLRDALITIIKAHEVAGKPDVALVYLRELMMQTKDVQKEAALTHHRAHLKEVEARYGAQRESVNPARADNVLREQEQVLREKLVEQVAEEELLRARMEMLERLAVTAELRDDTTGEHAYRVARLASILAREAGESASTCTMIDLAARLHDIGKIGVPDGVLLKNARLNEAEIRVMRTHSAMGAELLAQSQVPHLNLAEEIARFHHEWWDGTGYPFGIGGTAIPRAARMVALADVFDALTHSRPYKEPWAFDRALDQIGALKGRQFDPELTELFIAMLRRMHDEGVDLDEVLGEAARHSPLLRAREKIAATLRKFSIESAAADE
jgi:putative two-component system response regulator